MKQVEEIKQKIALGLMTKTELSERLGITRVTLDRRLERNDWKKAELHLLKSIV